MCNSRVNKRGNKSWNYIACQENKFPDHLLSEHSHDYGINIMFFFLGFHVTLIKIHIKIDDWNILSLDQMTKL